MTDTITLKASLEKGGGATDAWMVIDSKDLVFNNDGEATVVVGKVNPHNFVIWMEGPAASTVEFEIKQGAHSLAKGKLTVSFGNHAQVGHGTFSHA